MIMMSFIKKIISAYSLAFPRSLVYMFQVTEYNALDVFKWILKTKDFNKVMHRNKLKYTKKSVLLLGFVYLVFLSVLFFGLGYIWGASSLYGILEGVGVVLSAPVLGYLLLSVVLILGTVFVQKPQEFIIINKAKKILQNHKATKIAVVGSYGKTSMKEILNILASSEKNVKVTPGNKNTPLGISSFIKTLEGDEDILIFEFGEGKQGDVDKLSKLVRPDFAVITGVSEAHLRSFGNVENITKTIFEIEKHVDAENIYVNDESKYLPIKNPDMNYYNREGCGNVKVAGYRNSLKGLKIDFLYRKNEFSQKTELIGEHHVGPISGALALCVKMKVKFTKAVDEVHNIKAYEHRMQPKKIAGGALVIDDTYNGNPSGVEAGLVLLKNAKANRRVYVTPGLVELGKDSDDVHVKIGEKIAKSCDVVYLMSNSTTKAILAGLKSKDFSGEIKIIDNPLQFYTNLDMYFASGDVVLMQNDWSDGYV